jgi:hypothetical protein
MGIPAGTVARPVKTLAEVEEVAQKSASLPRSVAVLTVVIVVALPAPRPPLVVAMVIVVVAVCSAVGLGTVAGVAAGGGASEDLLELSTVKPHALAARAHVDLNPGQ